MLSLVLPFSESIFLAWICALFSAVKLERRKLAQISDCCLADWQAGPNGLFWT